MYAQFFGNFLLSRDIITREQLLSAMEKKATRRIKLGTLAMHAGYMSANEVEHIKILQTHQDRKFGELAIESGILTKEQVDELLKAQVPNFLLLGEVLVDEGIIDNYQLETLVNEYESESGLYALEYDEDPREKIETMLKQYMQAADNNINEYELLYNVLLFNNLVRFIGEDFTPIYSTVCTEYPKNFCITQKITGPFDITLYIDMPESVCIAFASRYVGEDFEQFDEYVQASIEDFANLHNGLYCVNLSNTKNVELQLMPPEIVSDPVLMFEHQAFLMPIIFPFGSVNFIFELNDKNI